MSVVNQMLLDIDRRRAEAGLDTNPNAEIRGVNPGLPKVPLATSARSGRRAILAIVVCSLSLLVGVAVWWLMRTTKAAMPVAHAPSAARPASPNPTPIPIPTPIPTPTPAPNTADAAAVHSADAVSAAPKVATADPIPTSATVSAAVTAAAPGAQPPNSSPATSEARLAAVEKSAMKLSMQLSALVAEAPAPLRSVSPRPTPSQTLPAVAPPAPPQPGTTTITTVPNPAPQRQVAADETVRVARALWADGSRTAATATLREALASAESSRNHSAAAALARELARLDIADNRAQAALDLLRRLEPILQDDVDAWALRGNAEQRLGLHTDAAESYLAALRARPTEGKWMIGAAISLAASGKTDEARIWVERARERGAVTPTIASYLQQLGISTRP